MSTRVDPICEHDLVLDFESKLYLHNFHVSLFQVTKRIYVQFGIFDLDRGMDPNF